MEYLKKRIGLLALVLFLVAGRMDAHAPYLEITGKVTDENNVALPGVNVMAKGTTTGTVTDINGEYLINVPSEKSILVFSFVGYETKEKRVGKSRILNISLISEIMELEEVVDLDYAVLQEVDMSVKPHRKVAGVANGIIVRGYATEQVQRPYSTEDYLPIDEIGFKGAKQQPLSTFSIDVDAASYSNVRRFIESGQRPPVDAVKIEELINYFDYDYKQPENGRPFSVQTEVAKAPWNPDHRLVHIGLQGQRIDKKDLPASNLVFLIDVSGSMSDYNKLPLLKSAFRLLVNELRPEDRVSIVVYAGAAGVVLPPTTGSEKATILEALDNLQAGGSTAGSEGIRLAYEMAGKHFVEEGNNRVILATDGDFNIGISSTGELQRLIESKRDKKIFLTCLGFGMGNYKDSKMETLAQNGDGNYSYIDDLSEAKKVFVNEFGATMFTIAKDVKLQVEFNPATVQAYRLIGYENRMLQDEDFNNDKKDAGDMGAGHSVTALYEIIPAGVKSAFYQVDDLKYQEQETGKNDQDLLTVKIRYKSPEGGASHKFEVVVHNSDEEAARMTENFRWSAAVAGYGMWLRNSEYLDGMNLESLHQMAKLAKGADQNGYRSEFIHLMDLSELLQDNQ